MSKLTYREACARGSRILLEGGIPEHDLEARRLLEHVCHTTYAALYTHPDKILTGTEQSEYEALCKRRVEERIPLAYLTGSQSFMGLDFLCDVRALIPRQDTETLVEEARKHLHDGMRFLDLCTGSGAVALSLAYYTNDTRGTATDLSADAVSLAVSNAKRLQIDRVRFVVCDLFPGAYDAPYDLICANPPYVRSAEIDALQKEIAAHEPRMALDGGADGLDFYRRITAQAHTYLNRGGWLLAETGDTQTEDVAGLFEGAGYKHIAVVKDLAGLPRVVKGCYYV